MKCARCDNALDDNALFCGQCGAVVGASYAPPSEQVGFASPTPLPAPPPAAPAAANFPRSAMHATSLAARVKAILLTPKTEWPVIADENTSARATYLGYVAPLAAIGAIALFYGLYLLYLGLPVLMRCPQQQAVPYTGVVLACAVVLFLFLGGLTTCAAGLGPGVFI